MNTNTAKNPDQQPTMMDPFSGQAFHVIEGGRSTSSFQREILAAIEEAIGKSDLQPKGTESLDYRELASPNIKRMPYDELVQFVVKAIVRHRQEKPKEIVDKDRLIRATTKGFRYKGIDLSDEVIESIVEEAIETDIIRQSTRKNVSKILPLRVVGQQRDAS
jgi:hypothetical protein